jgi:hypothetical protein
VLIGTHGRREKLGDPGADTRAAEELRSQARALYRLAKATPDPHESLLHVLHALELEADADLLERRDLPQAGTIDSPNPSPDCNNL